MKKKKGQFPKGTKPSWNKKLIMVSIVIVAVFILGFLLYSFILQNQEVKFSFKAAIIDQLGEEFSNSEFNETGLVTSILRSAGFNVSYHRSQTINVAFYKMLAKYNYGIIILRVHSATREGETIVDFFTSEEFSINRYVSEQHNGLLTRGYYSWNPEKFYFAISPKFIESLEGYFPKSIVIAMGCNSLNVTCREMAEAFIKKGAKIYIGWTGLVESSHTDNETIKLLREFLVENKTLSGAIALVKSDPLYRSKMEYYPLETGNVTMFDLVTEANARLTSQSEVKNFGQSIFSICVINIAWLRFKRTPDLTFY